MSYSKPKLKKMEVSVKVNSDASEYNGLIN